MIRAALFLLLIAPAHAAPIEAQYTAYAAGLQVVSMKAEFDVGAAYHVRLSYRTTGAVNLLLHSAQDTVVDGAFTEAGRPQPSRFFSTGTLRGAPRVTQIDYRGGQPSVRQLQPPNEEEREPVPEAQQAHTIDSLSAMADLVRRVNTTGGCDGRVTTFDGRRLAELEAHSGGRETLEPSARSSFSGPAVRCDFTGRQIAGFRHDADAKDKQIQHGSAWFAALTPGGPLIPVRISFRTRWFGDAVMYVTG